MIIKDSMGKYTIEIDKSGKIVKETPIGLWKKEDVERFHKDYETKVMPQLRAVKSWAVISDLREYKTSNVVEELSNHVMWKIGKGLQSAAIIVASAITKMQMKRTGGTAMEPMPFTSEKEARDWLKDQGF
ncbi:hypothetical protein [Wukongibacter sp. M2B1]|uniref:hypothetical protein n=1 Tax=Wukongibacter sp. M2B1 TaxID=3088895 RepID=UPI003D7A215E